MEEKPKHYCEGTKYKSKDSSYGYAVTTCFEDSFGNLWVSNDEYSNTVNFCPFCGYEAPKQLEDANI